MGDSLIKILAQEVLSSPTPNRFQTEIELISIILTSKRVSEAGDSVNFAIEPRYEVLGQRVLRYFESLYGLKLIHRLVRNAAKNHQVDQSLRVYFDHSALSALKKLRIVSPYNTLVRGLPTQVNSATIDNLTIALKIFVLNLAGFKGKELFFSIDNFILANAILGVFHKFGLRPERKNVRDSAVILNFSDATTVANFLEIIGSTIALQQYRELYPNVPPSVVAGETKILIPKLLRPLPSEIMLIRIKRALEILQSQGVLKKTIAMVGELRLQYPQKSVEELGKLAQPELTKDAVAGRLRRLLKQADQLAEQLFMEDTLTFALRETHKFEED
jgi:DNA-binding transcriptional regulator WhiA